MLLKTWHIFRGVFSLAGMTLCVLILILEIKGLPENLILGIRQELDSKDLHYSIDEVHMGPISGIKINNITVEDPSQEIDMHYHYMPKDQGHQSRRQRKMDNEPAF